MKFSITLKDPDGPYDCFEEEAQRWVDEVDDLDLDEKQALFEVRRDKLKTFATQWIEYGEYVTIDFDMEAGTATVRRV